MLNVSHIQHFSVGDGDGIRTTLFFKGCNLRCPWCHNPENLSAAPVTLRYTATGKTETVGRLAAPEELLPELLEDKDYYAESGGGVTFSGGEVMLQAEEAATLAALLLQNGVSTLVDTAGCVPYAGFERLNPFVAGYLFDIKTADAAKYRQIGGDLALICDNLARLRADGKAVTVRIPLIPGFNTDTDATKALCERLAGLGIGHVDLLPFHRLGSAKYEAMGLTYPYREQPPIPAEELRALAAAYGAYFTVRSEG